MPVRDASKAHQVSLTDDEFKLVFSRLTSTAKPDGSPGGDRLRIAGTAELNGYDRDLNRVRCEAILLAAADFSKELTTAVMWLIDRSIDIRCIRMKPYRMADGTLLLDMQQLIPLPEATAFQTQIGVKKQAERQSRTDRHDLRLRFWEGLLEAAKGKSDVHANRKPTTDGWISGGINRAGFNLTYTTRRTDSQVELWIAHGTGQAAKNKAAFKALEAQKGAIEADFGAPLDWQELPEGEGCRIRYLIDWGYKSPVDQWSSIHTNMVDAMARLDNAMRQRVAQLNY